MAKARMSKIPKSKFHVDFCYFAQLEETLSSFAAKKYGSVLDFGAGHSPYRCFFDCERYVTVDIEQNQEQNIDHVIGVGESIPCEDDSFDLVICMDVLEHCPDTFATLSELRRVLKKEGLLLVLVPFLYREHEMPADFHRFTSVGMAKALGDVGMRGIEVYKLGNRWYTVAATWFEMHIEHGETYTKGIFSRIIRKLASLFIFPILNVTIFKPYPTLDESTFHHLLTSCKK